MLFRLDKYKALVFYLILILCYMGSNSHLDVHDA